MGLTCVQVSLPADFKGVVHVHEAVNAYLTPPTLNGAARHGCLGVLERFKSKPCSTGAMQAALDGGHYTTIKWLVTNKKLAPGSIVPNEALKRAAEQGESEAAELLATDCSDFAIEKALKYAARKGTWRVVEVLYKKCQPGCDALGEALKTAAKMGEREVVELIWRECGEKDVARSLEGAAEEGRWEVVAVLFKHCDPESKEIGAALISAIEKAKWDMVEMIYPRCGEKYLVAALKLVALQCRWDTAKLLCEKLQRQGYLQALELVDKDDGRTLLDLLYRRCRCYDAEKAIVGATTHLNWTAIKLLADMCYKNSSNVCKAFKLAADMDRWDVVKCLYQECSDNTVLEAMEQAAVRGKRNIVSILKMRCSTSGVTAALSQLSIDDKRVLEVPQSKPQHHMIRCIVPGFSPFEIDVSLVETVGDMKRLLHAERPDCFGAVAAESIWLYLAKRGSEWLSSDSEDMNLLEVGDTARVRDLLVWQMMSSSRVKDIFESVSEENTIHLIALNPMLRCIIPGSRPFGINLDTIMRIEDLKKAIKTQMPDDFSKVNASDMKLYLAKENGKWLSLSSSEAKALMVGERSPGLNNILARQLSSMTDVGNPFADVYAIHVIVLSPTSVLSAFRDVSSTRRFRWDLLNAKLQEIQ
ncbi:Ankyrin repeat and SAM domain-containing protein 3 [Phytophthora pseudosyringae]|uniref:Ankyrin repeat and SAM domain-containing protein 3 n=1 Tax=Phytophthora pseudosyringae TaxID=221518 RepID=A0A8T1VFB3_9STRA|nr:Ankyrin repeat and SAM domain-containing protein 3 [Phytophthora pseudosyringae]